MDSENEKYKPKHLKKDDGKFNILKEKLHAEYIALGNRKHLKEE